MGTSRYQRCAWPGASAHAAWDIFDVSPAMARYLAPASVIRVRPGDHGRRHRAWICPEHHDWLLLRK